jgi:hypothetical protein
MIYTTIYCVMITTTVSLIHQKALDEDWGAGLAIQQSTFVRTKKPVAGSRGLNFIDIIAIPASRARDEEPIPPFSQA